MTWGESLSVLLVHHYYRVFTQKNRPDAILIDKQTASALSSNTEKKREEDLEDTRRESQKIPKLSLPLTEYNEKYKEKNETRERNTRDEGTHVF